MSQKKNKSGPLSVGVRTDGYEEWIRSIKERVQRARIKATMLANSEQILLYWDVGHDILSKQNREGWGTKVVERMSADLKAAFPDMKGWSRSNLMYMRQFAEAWTRREIVQAPLGQLPWYHHLALLKDAGRLTFAARMLVHPSGSASPNLPSEMLRISAAHLEHGRGSHPRTSRLNPQGDIGNPRIWQRQAEIAGMNKMV